MRICIHRGAHEIGGACVELESEGKRIVLDIGLPLDALDAKTLPLYPMPGFNKPDPSLLGVIISHPHQDHYVLSQRLLAETPFLIGKSAEAILQAADLFTPAGLNLKHAIRPEDRRPITLGPFTITPCLVDHSAYDNYAVLVGADGRRLCYSGDFRAHDRKAKLVADIVEGRVIEREAADEAILNFAGTVLFRMDAMRDSLLQDLPGDQAVMEPLVRRKLVSGGGDGGCGSGDESDGL